VTGGPYRYDPFGNPTGGTPDNSQGAFDYGWLGEHQRGTDNTASGIIQMGARPYISALGRFLAIDPIEGGNANDYTYPNEPLMQFDLTGTCGTACPLAPCVTPVIAIPGFGQLACFGGAVVAAAATTAVAVAAVTSSGGGKPKIKKCGREVKPAGWHCHHIVAKNHARHKALHSYFAIAALDIDDPENLVALPQVCHARIHSHKHLDDTFKVVDKAGKVLREIHKRPLLRR
jgi:RHS repeat-associated protein